MPFSLKNSSYPVEFGNFQRNSYIPIEIPHHWKPAWSKSFDDIDPEFLMSPRAVLVQNSLIAVKGASDLILYSQSGDVKYHLAIGNPTPVVLGAEAMAFFDETSGLVYLDYERKSLRPEEPVPGYDEWAHALLIRPSMDDVVGVIQNAGIRGQREKKFYIYRFVRDSLTSRWYHEFPGMINQALVTTNEKMLVAIAGETVTLYDMASGKIALSFKTGLANPLAASLSPDNELIIIGTAEDIQGAKKYCQAFSLDGEKLWSLNLINPVLTQYPVCGEEKNVYIIDSMQLKCVTRGTITWATPPLFGDRSCLTVTKGNFVLVLDDFNLYLYAPDGQRLFECLISREGDQFGIPPAIDFQGRIYILSDKKLYCFE